MLIEYYGKLPHKSEFISSDQSPTLQLLTAWIECGQNHLGESMLRSHHQPPPVYFFVINQPISPSSIVGVFLKSCDRRSRSYPFVVYHQHATDDLDDVALSYQALFDKLGFQMGVFNQAMNNTELLNRYTSFLQRFSLPIRGALWRNVCDDRVLISDKLSAVSYRKLMTGDFS